MPLKKQHIVEFDDLNVPDVLKKKLEDQEGL
jgi:hypothetical protein